MKILDSTIQDYTGTNFSVYKREEGETIIKYNTSGDIIENNEMYSKVMLGKCETCNPFFKNSFDGFSYDTVLVVGLGLGLIPYELSEVNGCSKIDVLEIDQEIIDYTRNYSLKNMTGVAKKSCYRMFLRNITTLKKQFSMNLEKLTSMI